MFIVNLCINMDIQKTFIAQLGMMNLMFLLVRYFGQSIHQIVYHNQDDNRKFRLTNSQCPPPLGIRGRGNDFCVISQAGGKLLNFKSQGGDTFRGWEDDFRQSSRGRDCFIMMNCWYFHKMLHLEFYKFCLRRYLIFF